MEISKTKSEQNEQLNQKNHQKTFLKDLESE